ncbi:hypothetical protein EON77_10275, partial [bacterium]
MSDEEFLIEDLMIRKAMGETLAPPELARLESAVAADPERRSAARAIEQSLVALAVSTRIEPPRALRDRVLASTARIRPASSPRWPFALAASVTLLAIAGATFLFQQNQRLRLASEQQNEAARMLLEPNVVLSYRMTGVIASRATSGIVLLDLDAKRASISMRGLPPLPEGQAYY